MELSLAQMPWYGVAVFYLPFWVICYQLKTTDHSVCTACVHFQNFDVSNMKMVCYLTHCAEVNNYTLPYSKCCNVLADLKVGYLISRSLVSFSGQNLSWF